MATIKIAFEMHNDQCRWITHAFCEILIVLLSIYLCILEQFRCLHYVQLVFSKLFNTWHICFHDRAGSGDKIYCAKTDQLLQIGNFTLYLLIENNIFHVPMQTSKHSSILYTSSPRIITYDMILFAICI